MTAEAANTQLVFFSTCLSLTSRLPQLPGACPSWDRSCCWRWTG